LNIEPQQTARTVVIQDEVGQPRTPNIEPQQTARIAVIGADGFPSEAFMEALKARHPGYEVVCIDSLSDLGPEVIVHDGLHPCPMPVKEQFYGRERIGKGERKAGRRDRWNGNGRPGR